jgi:phosphoribosylformimino-5-aminoimidazole carboxamide ribotide isomerase
MIIFPAIDILDQQCVRLTQGDYQQQSVYASDPLEVARTFEQKGAEFLHIVDLNAAKTGEPINNGLVCEIARALQIPIQVGGGIRTEEAVRSYLDCGVARVIIGTAAITKEGFLQELCKRYPGKICLSLDVREGKF